MCRLSFLTVTARSCSRRSRLAHAFTKTFPTDRPKDLLKGVDDNSPDRERMNTIMRDFSASVTKFISQFLAPYAAR